MVACCGVARLSSLFPFFLPLRLRRSHRLLPWSLLASPGAIEISLLFLICPFDYLNLFTLILAIGPVGPLAFFTSALSTLLFLAFAFCSFRFARELSPSHGIQRSLIQALVRSRSMDQLVLTRQGAQGLVVVFSTAPNTAAARICADRGDKWNLQ